jgi:hypothetical protein
MGMTDTVTPRQLGILLAAASVTGHYFTVQREASDSPLFGADLRCHERSHRRGAVQTSAWPAPNARPRARVTGCWRNQSGTERERRTRK